MYFSDGSSLDPMFFGTSLQSLLSLDPSLFVDGFCLLVSLTDDPTLRTPVVLPSQIRHFSALSRQRGVGRQELSAHDIAEGGGRRGGGQA